MLYLAMTATEIAGNPLFSGNIAYMACHFAPYSTGLSNVPRALPPGSMLTVNDVTPLHHHDPDRIAQELLQAVETLECSRVLLDFQRDITEESQAVIQAVLARLPCPVAVSEKHGKDLTCPIFLPPVPPNICPEHYISAWAGRPVWLELALDAAAITITEAGSTCTSCTTPDIPLPHFDEALMCHYGLQLSENAAVFTLQRTWTDLQKLAAHPLIACCVGLYQELETFTGADCAQGPLC